MKISTEIESSALKVDKEKAIELIAKAGFDAWDFSMFDMCKYNWGTRVAEVGEGPLSGANRLAYARKLKQIGLDNGIVCNQSHAPFPTSNELIRSMAKWAIECTAEAGGEICIIHPDNDKSAEENGEFYMEFLPFAKDCGVKIATENMWNWNSEKDQATFAACATPESFLAHLNAVNSDYLVACLDIGHAEMRGLNTNAVQMIKALGGKLQALHIHDNDKWHDSHQIPFSMQIDFEAIAKALKEIGYSGYLTLEASYYLKDYPTEKLFEELKRLALSAKRIGELYNKD